MTAEINGSLTYGRRRYTHSIYMLEENDLRSTSADGPCLIKAILLVSAGNVYPQGGYALRLMIACVIRIV